MKLLVFLTLICVAKGQFNPHFSDGRSGIVHLFEWKWLDIAKECENFLAPKGFGGVQISPPNENAVIEGLPGGRPWWERYQPVSYKIISRSGNETEFLEMTKRCNQVGIRIYADVVINHMAGATGLGTGKSSGDGGQTPKFPEVPYGPDDFRPDCNIDDYWNKYKVQNCRLTGLPDLKLETEHVRGKIVDYLNKLVDLGVAGFRVDAVKHMDAEDLKNIYKRVKNLNPDFGFPKNVRPFIYQEVIDHGHEGVKSSDYTSLGVVTEFKFSKEIGSAFGGKNALKWLRSIGECWGFLPSDRALVFVDNHDNQRDGAPFLNYQQSRQYKMASAFNAAWPYGIKQYMSSFAFNKRDDGPPSNEKGELLSPEFGEDDSCLNGWVCEHRWRQIYNMIEFANVVKGTGVTDWSDNGNSQIAFGRGDKGFIVFNGEGGDLNKELQTSLEPGVYCDVISGHKKGNACTGMSVTIDENKKGFFKIAGWARDGVLAFHVNSKLD